LLEFVWIAFIVANEFLVRFFARVDIDGHDVAKNSCGGVGTSFMHQNRIFEISNESGGPADSLFRSSEKTNPSKDALE